MAIAKGSARDVLIWNGRILCTGSMFRGCRELSTEGLDIMTRGSSPTSSSRWLTRIIDALLARWRIRSKCRPVCWGVCRGLAFRPSSIICFLGRRWCLTIFSWRTLVLMAWICLVGTAKDPYRMIEIQLWVIRPSLKISNKFSYWLLRRPIYWKSLWFQ